MEQMILSKYQKQTKKKQKQIMYKKSRLWGSQVGEWMDCDGWAFAVFFWDVDCDVCNGWAMGSYCRAQGNVCDWVTLLYSRPWGDIVNEL